MKFRLTSNHLVATMLLIEVVLGLWIMGVFRPL